MKGNFSNCKKKKSQILSKYYRTALGNCAMSEKFWSIQSLRDIFIKSFTLRHNIYLEKETERLQDKRWCMIPKEKHFPSYVLSVTHFKLHQLL